MLLVGPVACWFEPCALLLVPKRQRRAKILNLKMNFSKFEFFRRSVWRQVESVLRGYLRQTGSSRDPEAHRVITVWLPE